MPPFIPPWPLHPGLSMTLYIALVAHRTWQRTLDLAPVPYQNQIFIGQGETPIFGRWATPPLAKGTIIATYGITGSLENQWLLEILGRKAYHRGYGVVVFDWRGHGKTAELSPTLTSDGIYEGEDYLALATRAKDLGCPPPYWLVGYSLSGQLALWGGQAAMHLPSESTLKRADIGGVAVVCPNLDANRSLRYLTASPLGRQLEQSITRELRRMAQRLYQAHPDHIDPGAIARARSIWTFDQELVIPHLGFSSVEDYYAHSSPLTFMADLNLPVLILYAADDPLFDPALIPELQGICHTNPNLELMLTNQGGHVGYYSSRTGQHLSQDPDPWWAWNRVLEWIDSRG